MLPQDVERLIAGARAFGWDSDKRATNLRVHKIDFENVKGIFDGPTFIRRSDRHGEIRYQVFGFIEGREVAVACTFRGEVCWLISARRARKDERRKFHASLTRQASRED